MTNAIKTAVYRLGGPSRLARQLGLTHATVCGWIRHGNVPHRHVVDLARAGQVYPHDLNAGFPLAESNALAKFWKENGSWPPQRESDLHNALKRIQDGGAQR